MEKRPPAANGKPRPTAGVARKARSCQPTDRGLERRLAEHLAQLRVRDREADEQ